VPPGRLQPRRQRARRSVAEETKTPPLANAAAPPCGPNRIASVCAAVTTTETTAAVSLAVSAGVAAPWPPAAGEPCRRGRIDVAPRHREACAQQRLRHADPHRPETDHRDALRCHRTLPLE
jgi:hypothetical protein